MSFAGLAGVILGLPFGLPRAGELERPGRAIPRLLRFSLEVKISMVEGLRSEWSMLKLLWSFSGAVIVLLLLCLVED